MKTSITEFEAQALLKQESRRAKSKAILDKSAMSRATLLLSSVATGASIFFMGDFDAPLAVKAMLSMAVTGAVVGQFETWRLQRRLDAAIELLRQAEQKRG